MLSRIRLFLGQLTHKDIYSSIRIGIIGSLVILVGWFSITRTHDLLFGTPLNILSPDDGTKLNDNHVRIVGKAPNAANIYIDDAKILPDENGSFVQEYILAPGLNIFEIRADDRFGREKSKILSLIYEGGSSDDE